MLSLIYTWKVFDLKKESCYGNECRTVDLGQIASILPLLCTILSHPTATFSNNWFRREKETGLYGRSNEELVIMLSKIYHAKDEDTWVERMFWA